MNKKVLWFLIIVLSVVGGYLTWTTYSVPQEAIDPHMITENTPVACTADAQMCPDGSYVGRSGPACEFTACPELTGWLTATTTSHISFQYPEKLPTTYITAGDWPPVVTLTTDTYSCLEAGTPVLPAGKTEKRMINDYEYCRTIESEGAAGSIYTNYAYSWAAIKGNAATLTFSLKSVQCLNYDDPQKTNCIKEQEEFDIDKLVAGIVQTINYWY